MKRAGEMGVVGACDEMALISVRPEEDDVVITCGLDGSPVKLHDAKPYFCGGRNDERPFVRRLVLAVGPILPSDGLGELVAEVVEERARERLDHGSILPASRHLKPVGGCGIQLRIA